MGRQGPRAPPTWAAGAGAAMMMNTWPSPGRGALPTWWPSYYFSGKWHSAELVWMRQLIASASRGRLSLGSPPFFLSIPLGESRVCVCVTTKLWEGVLYLSFGIVIDSGGREGKKKGNRLGACLIRVCVSRSCCLVFSLIALAHHHHHRRPTFIRSLSEKSLWRACIRKSLLFFAEERWRLFFFHQGTI